MACKIAVGSFDTHAFLVALIPQTPEALLDECVQYDAPSVEASSTCSTDPAAQRMGIHSSLIRDVLSRQDKTRDTSLCRFHCQ
jgi:hypothetical protein